MFRRGVRMISKERLRTARAWYRSLPESDQQLLRRQWLKLDPAERQRVRLELRRMAPEQRNAWLQRLRQ